MTENCHGEIRLSDRKKLTVSGVNEIVSFDESSVVFETTLGTLHIDGSALAVTRLDLDAKEASCEGTVNGVYYMETRKPKRKRREK